MTPGAFERMVARLAGIWPAQAERIEATGWVDWKRELGVGDERGFLDSEVSASVDELIADLGDRPLTLPALMKRCIAKAAERRAAAKAARAAETSCICGERLGAWRECQASHTDGWMDRRAAEAEALRIVRDCAASGSEVPVGSYPRTMHDDLRAASIRDWYDTNLRCGMSITGARALKHAAQPCQEMGLRYMGGAVAAPEPIRPPDDGAQALTFADLESARRALVGATA